MTSREEWLNGWHRVGDGVLIGTTVHCAGCGCNRGLASIAIQGDEKYPEKMPDWPFDEASCPVHNRPAEQDKPKDRLTERLVALQRAKQK